MKTHQKETPITTPSPYLPAKVCKSKGRLYVTYKGERLPIKQYEKKHGVKLKIPKNVNVCEPMDSCPHGKLVNNINDCILCYYDIDIPKLRKVSWCFNCYDTEPCKDCLDKWDRIDESYNRDMKKLQEWPNWYTLLAILAGIILLAHPYIIKYLN